MLRELKGANPTTNTHTAIILPNQSAELGALHSCSGGRSLLTGSRGGSPDRPRVSCQNCSENYQALEPFQVPLLEVLQVLKLCNLWRNMLWKPRLQKVSYHALDDAYNARYTPCMEVWSHQVNQMIQNGQRLRLTQTRRPIQTYYDLSGRDPINRLREIVGSASQQAKVLIWLHTVHSSYRQLRASHFLAQNNETTNHKTTSLQKQHQTLAYVVVGVLTTCVISTSRTGKGDLWRHFPLTLQVRPWSGYEF